MVTGFFQFINASGRGNLVRRSLLMDATYHQAGEYEVTFTVTDDGAGNLTDTRYHHHGHNVNEPPVLTAIGNKSVLKTQPELRSFSF